MPKVFFDTNILVYGYDGRYRKKQDIALTLLEHAACERNGCVSTQILQEFYSISTRKIHLPPMEVKEKVLFFSGWELAVVSPGDIQKAIDGNILWQVSFWDALVLVAATKLKCELIYTEDLNHGQVINGVRIVNPFAGKEP